MPTNLAIDDNLLNEAQKIGKHKTKKNAVNEALREYIERRKRKEIISLFGKAELRNHLMRNGKQVGTIDALIASAAISYECSLFTADQDFTYIAMHSKLKLLNKK